MIIKYINQAHYLIFFASAPEEWRDDDIGAGV